MKLFLPILLTFSLFISSCNDATSKQEKEIKNIHLTVEFDRFDKRFYEDSISIEKLKTSYPYFFSSPLTNAQWEEKRKDSLLLELYQETQHTFKNFDFYKKEITKIFKRMRYHFKSFEIPKVITVISEVDYMNKVILTDSILAISLDTYLGSDHKFYGSIYRYMAQNLKKEQLLPDIAQELASSKVKEPKGRRFLDHILTHGKIQYIKEQLIPNTPKYERLRYTSEQMSWIKANELEIWKYFIQKELFFSTDKELLNRFIKPGPYSRFNLILDQESPPRIGIWLGYELVKSYMLHHHISLQELLQKTSNEIFNQSHYKPKKS